MTNNDNSIIEKIENQNKRNNINHMKNLVKEDIEQFNSFKYKHFNNFFYNIIKDQLKYHQIKNLELNKNYNESKSLIKNEFLNKTLYKKMNLQNKSNNKNKIEIDNFDNSNLMKKPKLKDNKSINKNSLPKFNFKNQKKSFPYINSKYINKGQNTNPIPNILQPKEEKIKNKINSRNISFIQNEYINKSINEENKKYYKTSESNFIYRNKYQQLPKDAVNNLLSFLKKNKKHLARTSKYYNIYKNYKNFIDNGDENSSIDENKNIKKYNNYNVNIGYYVRKSLDGLDIYDTTSTYRYKYNNKSEKSRHEIILAELNRLKGYIDKNKKEKELFIKDFLNKYNINCDDANKLKYFEKFLLNFNNNQFNNLLKPYLGIKEMILDILEEGAKINKNENNKIYINNNDNKIKKFNSLSAYNLQSSNIILNNKNKFMPQEENIFNHPLITPQQNIISEEKNNNTKSLTIDNDKNDILNNNNNMNINYNKLNYKEIKKFDLFDTNSYLKQIEKQTRIHIPLKDYASNNILIVKEIGNELEKLTTNIKTEKKYKNNPKIKKPNINKNNNFITQSSNKSIEDIFITSNVKYTPVNNISRIKKKDIENINSNKIKNNNHINKMKIVKKTKKENLSLDKKRKNYKRQITRLILDKLNLRPKINKIEIEDVKKRLKLTEYIVYNNARRKLMFEELGKKELYEYVNNITNN